MTELKVIYLKQSFRDTVGIAYTTNNVIELLKREPLFKEEVYDEIEEHINLDDYALGEEIAVWRDGNIEIKEPS